MNWPAFLTQHRIPFEEDPKAKKFSIEIKCPWCGEDDPSMHLGIAIDGRGYSCWRNRQHRGARPQYLIMALIHCSYNEAMRIAGEATAPMITDRNVGDEIAALFDQDRARDDSAIEFTPDIKRLRNAGLGKAAFAYLMGRKYAESQVQGLVDLYGLRYAFAGPFANRIVVPVVMPQGLVTWTGRAISDFGDLRYRTLSTDPEKAHKANLPVAALPIEHTLWNYGMLVDQVVHWRALIVCEGPFDAMRLDYFGRRYGVRATCVFGTGNLSMEQIELLCAIRSRFYDMYMMFDQGAEFTGLARVDRMSYAKVQWITCPAPYKDPALIDEGALRKFFARLK